VNFEKRLICKLENEENKKQDQIHPILQKIQLQVSEYILNLHIEQFSLCSRYLVDTTNLFNFNQDEFPKFKVKSIDSKDENSFRTVTLENNNYLCECPTFIQHGVICRHIFYVSFMRQEKDLGSLKIHPHWLLKKEETQILLSNEALFEDLIQEKNIQENINKDSTSETIVKTKKQRVKKGKKEAHEKDETKEEEKIEENKLEIPKRKVKKNKEKNLDKNDGLLFLIYY